MRIGMVLVLIALSAVAPARAAGLSGANDPSIVIGFVATRSGAGAVGGLDSADGFALALKQLGGRLSNQEVRVVPVDDKGSPDVARRQLARIIASERLDMIVTAVSPSSLAAMLKPLAESRLFVLNLEMPPPRVAGPDCNANMFTLAPPNDGPHQVLGYHLVADGARRLVVIAPETGLADLAVAALKSSFPFEVTVLRPKRGAATFEREIRRIGEIKPDAVYSLLGGGMGGAFIRTYDAAGGKDMAPLYVSADAIARPLLQAMGDAALDVRAVANWSPDQEVGGNKRLVSDFEGEFGRPASERAARGYDAALLLDAAIKANNGRTHDVEAMRAALRRAEFPSVRGTFHFNHNHQPIMAYLLLKVTRDARGRLTHETMTPLLKEWRDPHSGACAMHWADEYVPAPPKPSKKN
ncbi:ABC transporter substrate-binding protein [Magnetospirillum sulfuroxidans]|uniref:ABC transporter substrate-binding protein n=1 Tax=Magnetospirillum sulfuroxidans TaxID=611300 RepID=A0ABS5IJ74_9PROT|nr:ABC transporter substrate-binding protein [Magnetospirillum sulfuroxidans]MBR9973758.1 ABC transporter substrate-binding protein [Magnetospirillum sulfuroxidans]